MRYKDGNKKSKQSQAQRCKAALRKRLHPKLICRIEPDIRLFEWPKRKRIKSGPTPTQLELFEENTMNNTIEQLLKRPIAFHPIFSQITGSVLAGLFLSQCYYWTNKTVESGWFYKTHKEFTDETTLSKKEQATARKLLVKMDLIEEKLKGLPAKNYYRVKVDNLVETIKDATKHQQKRAFQLDVPARDNLLSRPGATTTKTTSEITSKNSQKTHRHLRDVTHEAEDGQDDFEPDSEISENFISEFAVGLDDDEDLEFDFDIDSSLRVSASDTRTNGHSDADVFQPSLLPTHRKKQLKANKGKTSAQAIHLAYRSDIENFARICFLIGSEEMPLLRPNLKARIVTAIQTLEEAGQDIKQIRRFGEWWAATWMSKQKGTMLYNPPTPERVVEFWAQFKQQVATMNDDAVKLQTDVSNEVLLKAMAARASDRQKQ